MINRGFLLKNKDKKQPHQPDYKGEITLKIRGEEGDYHLSGWIHQDESGEEYLSIKIGYSIY